jgi:hypothetical protein
MTDRSDAAEIPVQLYSCMFAVIAAAAGAWLLIDFGLARRYTDDTGSHLPRRPDASFRGSTTYASVHAHRDEDLSRRDDLWSWMYMIIELIDGEGPLRDVRWVVVVMCVYSCMSAWV